MISDEPFPRKLSIQISEEQYRKLEPLSYGLRTAVFRKLVDDIGVLLEVHGEFVVTAIVQGQISIADIARSAREARDGKPRNPQD